MSLQALLEKHLRLEIMRHEALKRGEIVSPVPPNHIYIEPTNACILKCAMCTPPEAKGELGFMDPATWRRIIDSMEKHGIVAPVTMIGRGEPLMHKKIVEFVQYATDRNVPCYIITNGVLLTQQLAEGLVRAGIAKIQVSIHAHSPETYKKITGKDYFRQVQDNILRLVEINKEEGGRCFVATMACESSLNTHEMVPFREFWAQRVDRVFTTKLYSIQGNSKMADEAKSLYQSPQSAHPGCVMPWYFFGFRWNGNITPCPYDFSERFVIGNINESDNFDFMDCWNNEKMLQLRKSHLDKDFSYCNAQGYKCANCEVPFVENEFKAINRYLDNFPVVFSRQFGPLLKGE
ncbi:radical SAM protein [Solidesulfovibrio alcoholivorans]|uniref:radical SAM protein n=1 Tax=Solidesulfovibrio alcoholivorans TaxID=81406 RepID=UPI000497E697|nr:radical SAM protein [Solidesulfovibrio alcoholivorans]